MAVLTGPAVEAAQSQAAARRAMPLSDVWAPGASVARRAMIDGQLRVSGVSDPVVLAAMGALPREPFVPASARDTAYIDRAVPLGEGRFLAPPLSHGAMLAEAAPTPDDRALLIGGGTGYLSALLAPMVATLHVVESSARLALGGRIHGEVRIGPLQEGFQDGAPFSLIVIDGAIAQFPDSLAAQLADDGRVVTGLIERGVARLAVGRKAAGAVGFLTLGEIDLAPLAEFAATKNWSF